MKNNGYVFDIFLPLIVIVFVVILYVGILSKSFWSTAGNGYKDITIYNDNGFLVDHYAGNYSAYIGKGDNHIYFNIDGKYIHYYGFKVIIKEFNPDK